MRSVTDRADVVHVGRMHNRRRINARIKEY